MGFLLFGTAGLESGIVFLNKKLIAIGMQPKEYFYYVTLTLFPISALLFLFWPFTTSFPIFVILLVVASAAARAVSMISVSHALKNVKPLEISVYSAVAVLATYAIDVAIGAIAFKLVHFIAILLIVLGCLIIVVKNFNLLNGVKSAVIIKVAIDVVRGYLAYFTLMYLSSASYIFFMVLVSSIILIPLTKKITTVTADKVKGGLVVTMFGVFHMTFQNLLASHSATLYMLKAPAILIVTLLLSYFIKKDVGAMPTKAEVAASLIVVSGLTMFSVL